MSEAKFTPGPWKAGDYERESKGFLREAGFALRMGTEATIEEARIMRDALVVRYCDGHDTVDIDEREWIEVMEQCCLGE